MNKLTKLAMMSIAVAFGASAQAKKLNVLYIMSDDHSYQTITAYKHVLGQYAQTKNIDRLANEGTIFQRAYVANSICSPARATLLTGVHSHVNRKFSNRGAFDYSKNPQTFPELLQQNGYQTAMIGKWHLNCTPQYFDYSEVMPGQGLYYNPVFVKNGKKHIYKGYNTDITTDLALNWLDEQRNKDKPFAMLLHYKAAHRSFSPNLKHLNLFKDTIFPEPANFFDSYNTRYTAMNLSKMSFYNAYNFNDLKISYAYDVKRMNAKDRKIWEAHFKRENAPFLDGKIKSENELISWKYQRYMKDYLQVIRSLDENIGRVLDYLDKNGLAENTVVVYTSDQGFYMGEHGWFDKRYMYEESYRTPLLIRDPSVKKPVKSVVQLVQNIDFAPTILDYCGVEVPERMQGMSIKPLIAGNSDSWRKSLYYHYYEGKSSHGTPRHDGVSTKRWKLIHFYELKNWQLFDRDNDPNEMNNLYGKPGYEKVTAMMKAEYAKLKKFYKVPDSVYTMKIRN